MTTNTPELDAALALSRFGLGAREGSLASIGQNPRGALRDEIAARRVSIPVGPDLRSTSRLLAEQYAYQRTRNAALSEAIPAPVAKREPQMMQQSPVPAGDTRVGPPNPAQPVFLAEIDARFNGTYREPLIGFGERLVMFWANHFSIAVGKNGVVRIAAGAYEREAIRPHVFGHFEDMLLAVETHPAMLVFLDNQLSVGPHSQASGHGNRGLNENLAREIMELHTLGVDGGYSQRDVTSLARIITGWTVVRSDTSPLGAPGAFAFNSDAHEPGTETLLGVSYPDHGFAQGRAALRYLAYHPSTAKHIAFKLARHFVADVPPPALVSNMAATFTQTRGDLAAVYMAMLSSEDAWHPNLVKIRSPLEYLVALLRASGERPKPNLIAGALNAMGQPLWNPAGPNGFADTVDAWASSKGLSTRIDVANLVANATRSQSDPDRFAAEIMGPLLSIETRRAISRAESRAQGIAIAFLSPEFQRR